MASRVGPSSGLIVLVSQENAAHAHHSVDSTSSPRPIPAQVRSAAIIALTWVMANTNTRSKKSSSEVTFCSVSGGAATVVTTGSSHSTRRGGRRIPIEVPRANLIRRALFALVFAGVAAHLALALTVGNGPVIDWLYTALEVGALGLAAWRVVAVRGDRLGWGLITLGLALWTAGDLGWTL